jgi:hypothetical protein
MKEATQEISLKPVLHGFLLNSGKSITLAEILPQKWKLWKVLGLSGQQKSELPI